MSETQHAIVRPFDRALLRCWAECLEAGVLLDNMNPARAAFLAGVQS
jgi:hypothetical protein